MTYDEMVARVLAQFDVLQPTAEAWINERHKRMVAEAFWRLAEVALGTTEAGLSDYDLPDDVENVDYLLVGADTEPYWRTNPLDMARLRAGVATLQGAIGAFAIYADKSGGKQIRIWPTPTTAGAVIVGFTAIDPFTMTTGAAMSPIIPVSLHSYLKDGAFADGFLEADERPDLAQIFEQKYETGIDKLRRYKNRRLEGKGGFQQIQLVMGR